MVGGDCTPPRSVGTHLCASLQVWSVALVAPLALLAYLRLKTNLLGGGPPGSAVLTALDQVAGGGGSSTPSGKAAAGGKTGSESHTAGGGKDTTAAAAAPAPSKAGVCLMRGIRNG